MTDKYPTISTQNAEMFDVAAARRERLDTRLGTSDWTERAAGIDEVTRRELKAMVHEAQAEKLARIDHLNRRLGGAGINSFSKEKI